MTEGLWNFITSNISIKDYQSNIIWGPFSKVLILSTRINWICHSLLLFQLFCHLSKAPMDRIALNIKCKLWRTKNSFGIGMHAPVIEFQSVLWCTGRFRFDYQLASESLITHWWTANGYRFPIWVSNFQFSMCDSGCSFQRPSARNNVYFGCFYPAAQPISSLFFYSFVHELLMHRINTSDRSIHCQWLTWLNSLYRFEHPMGLAAVVDQYEDEPPLWNLQLWKSVCVPTFGILFLLFQIVSTGLPYHRTDRRPLSYRSAVNRVKKLPWVAGWLDAVHYKSLQHSSGNFPLGFPTSKILKKSWFDPRNTLHFTYLRQELFFMFLSP